MSPTITQKISAGAATAIAAGGFLAMPAAHAAANCTVQGAHLNLHQSSGYDVTIDAHGASLGPGAVIRETQEQSSYGNVSGGIKGRTIEFIIKLGGKAYIHFEGTVGDDGIAHGTSSEIIDPATQVLLNAGPWDTVDPLTCS